MSGLLGSWLSCVSCSRHILHVPIAAEGSALQSEELLCLEHKLPGFLGLCLLLLCLEEHTLPISEAGAMSIGKDAVGDKRLSTRCKRGDCSLCCVDNSGLPQAAILTSTCKWTAPSVYELSLHKHCQCRVGVGLVQCPG